MPSPAGYSPILGTFCAGRATATANTAFTQLIPPYPGPAGTAPQLYTVDAKGNPSWNDVGTTRIKRLEYVCGSTLHQLGIMRPLNWTYFTVGVAKAITLIPNAALKADPGVYSTNYKNPIPPGAVPAQAADNAMATGDYVVYQLADGTWQLDTIASGTFGSSLTLTTGTPNRTGATIPAFSPLFWYGIISDTDPATALPHPQWDCVVSIANVYSEGTGFATALRPGEPLIFYSPNITGAGKLGLISGTYDYD